MLLARRPHKCRALGLLAAHAGVFSVVLLTWEARHGLCCGEHLMRQALRLGSGTSTLQDSSSSSTRQPGVPTAATLHMLLLLASQHSHRSCTHTRLGHALRLQRLAVGNSAGRC